MIAIDTNKRPHLAQLVQSGMPNSLAFSMGCVCEQTRCSKCGHIAKTASDYCEHVRNKYTYPSDVFEWCEGVTFRELSIVKQPADRMARGLAFCYTERDGSIVCK